jgi:hypothetical protein
LLAASQREANFLRMIDRKAPILYEEDIVRNAIRRYETCWLPLQVRAWVHQLVIIFGQAARRDPNIIPPLDVHWVWHCHMLSPTHYRTDCETLVGAIIDHKLLSSDEIQQRYETSVKVGDADTTASTSVFGQVWLEHCGTEPYDFVASGQQNVHTTYKQRCSYDITAAVQRQRNFNYQVSLPHYTSPKYLNEAVNRWGRADKVCSYRTGVDIVCSVRSNVRTPTSS